MRPIRHLLTAALLAVLTPLTAHAATEVTWLGHAAFRIELDSGQTLVIDPWIKNPKNDQGEQVLAEPGRVDRILLTHGHPDHVGNAVALGKATGARLVAPFELGQQLKARGYPEDQVGMDGLMNIGGRIELFDGKVSVLMTPAVHSAGLATAEDGAPSHHYAANPVGYVIQVDGGPTIYHPGDTDVFGDMELIRELNPVDIMLAPIGGHFTMDPKRAAVAINRFIQPEAVIPMHYGTFPVLEGRPAGLEKRLDDGIEMHDLDINESARF